MEIENLKPNSHKYNEEQEQKQLEKVVVGDVKIRRKSLGRRFLNTFFNENQASIKEYLISDVLVPAIKNVILDLVNQGLSLTFWGEAKKSTTSSIGRTSYNKMFRPDSIRASAGRSRTVKDLDDIIVDSKGEAEMIINVLTDLVDRYGQATVGDLFDLLGETIPGDYISRDWGWTNLQGIRSVRVRDGYLIDLPRCISLK